MPVTKSAKRAARSSLVKKEINKKVVVAMEIAIREAKKNPSRKSVSKAISKCDLARKRKIIHTNKAARIKSRLTRLLKSSPKTTKNKK